MSRTSPEPAGPIDKQMLSKLTTPAFRWLSLSLQAIAIGFGLLVLWQGKNMLNSAIAQAPDVIAIHSEIKDVKGDLDSAKTAAGAAGAAAQGAAVAASGAVATQEKIFQLLNADRAERANANAELNSTLATLTERIAGVKEQLARVEAKQDTQK